MKENRVSPRQKFKQPTSNSVRNLGNMDILKVIQANIGVNILEEDPGEDIVEEEQASVKDESMFSTI